MKVYFNFAVFLKDRNEKAIAKGIAFGAILHINFNRKVSYSLLHCQTFRKKNQ